MLRTTLLVAAACAAVAGCAQELTRQERAVQEQILRDRVSGWSRALNNRDADSLATYYHQDEALTVAWPDGRRTRGWEEEAEAIRGMFRTVARMNLVVQDLEIDVLAPNVALATFRHSADIILTTTDRDIFTGQGTLVWTKVGEEDVWRIRAEQISRDPRESGT